jgi:hypothetical protein
MRLAFRSRMEICPHCGNRALDEVRRQFGSVTLRCLFCWKLVKQLVEMRPDASDFAFQPEERPSPDDGVRFR